MVRVLYCAKYNSREGRIEKQMTGERKRKNSREQKTQRVGETSMVG